LEKFKAWIDQILPATPPNSALGKALGYATRQWPKLVRHLDHPDIPVDKEMISYCTSFDGFDWGRFSSIH
jgi:Transposase IS66 family